MVSVTLDHWISIAKKKYQGMTAHYIDDNLVLRQHNMGCFLHEGKKTVAAIKEYYLKKHLLC